MGKLEVTVVSAKGLPDTQWISKPDPYVVVKVDGTSQPYKTAVKEDQLSPTWNETFRFQVADTASAQLRVEVWNSNVVADEFIGQYAMSLAGLVQGQPREVDALLQQCKSNAEVRIRLLAVDFGELPAPVAAAPAPVPPPSSVPAPVPQQGGPAPPGFYGAPGYGGPAPGYGGPAPGYGAPPPAYGGAPPPGPGYGQPPPGAMYGQPPPPGPGYGQPQMGYGAPVAGGMYAPPPGPGYGAPPPPPAPVGGYAAAPGMGMPPPQPQQQAPAVYHAPPPAKKGGFFDDAIAGFGAVGRDVTHVVSSAGRGMDKAFTGVSNSVFGTKK